MSSKITITHNKLEKGSCYILLQCLKQYPNLPTIFCEEAMRINNKKIEHQCILHFNEDKHVKNIWEKTQTHLPYIKDAELYIKNNYNGTIDNYIHYNDSLKDIPPFFFT
jgi:hypothetical protein